MHAISKLHHPDFLCLLKGQTSVVLSSIFCLNSVPNVYFMTPVEVLLELLLLVLNISSKSDFRKMLRHFDHDNLRPVLLLTPNTIRIDFRSLESHFFADPRIL